MQPHTTSTAVLAIAGALLAVLLCVLIATWAARVTADTGSGATSGAAGPGVELEPRDAERARARVARGEYVPLETILEDARARFPGRLLEVELDDDEYEVELLMPDGTKVELEYDARSGRLLEVEFDD